MLSGCEAKFRVLYQMYSDALLGIISGIVKSDEAAEDVLQETFVKIWYAKNQYDPAKGKIFTWMASAARHTAIDHLRSRTYLNDNRNSCLDECLKEVEKGNYTEVNQDLIGLEKLTEKLKCSDRIILELIYFQGYTHSEISRCLNIPIGTVKTSVRRSINMIRYSLRKDINFV